MLADRLGWQLLDTDLEIERVARKAVPRIFAEDGEVQFREMERRVLVGALSRPPGRHRHRRRRSSIGRRLVCRPLRGSGTLTVALDAAPESIFERLGNQQSVDGQTIERPLLAGVDPLSRIRDLKQQRQDAYDRADLTLVTDPLSIQDLTAQIASLVTVTDQPSVTLTAPGGESRIFVRRELSNRWGPW